MYLNNMKLAYNNYPEDLISGDFNITVRITSHIYFQFSVAKLIAILSTVDLKIFLIQATRATFQHTYLPDTPSQNEAVKSVKDSLSSIHFDNQTFESPIAYAFMYIQWEANEVKELITLEK